MSNTHWQKEITSKTKFFNFNLKETWDYKDLILLFIKRDIITKYKQTVLGPLWFLIQPICNTIMYLVVFGNLANLGTDGIPQVLFYFSGTMLWSYFSSVLTNSSNVFTNNKGLFGKVYFPRLTVPIATVVGDMIKFLIQFALFVVIYVVYMCKGTPVGASKKLLLIPIIVLWVSVLAMGFGLIVSAITTKYQDIAMALGYFISLGMYLTPVVYPLSEASNKLKILLYINPVTAPMEAFRIVCFGAGYVPTYEMIYSVLLSFILFIGGLAMFSKKERTFVDVI